MRIGLEMKLHESIKEKGLSRRFARTVYFRTYTFARQMSSLPSSLILRCATIQLDFFPLIITEKMCVNDVCKRRV